MKALPTPWKPRKSSAYTVMSTLWAADRARRLIESAGIEFSTFRIVLEQRLRLATDSRVGAQSHGITIGMGMILVGCGVCFASLIAGVAAIVTRDHRWWMLIGQGAWLMMLAMLSINYFANVLLDPTDVGVLASRPISDRAIFATRLAEVLLPTGLLALSALVLPTVFGLFTLHPLGALIAYPVSTLCAAMLVISGLTLTIALVLHLVGPRRFQRVMFWVQVVGATMIAAGPQVLSRVQMFEGVFDFYARHPQLQWLVPIEHYIALYELCSGDFAPRTIGLAACGVLVPLVFTLAALRLVRQGFAAAISDRGEIMRSRDARFAQSPFARLGRLVCRSDEARAIFGFTLAHSRRDKHFLRGMIPVAVMVIVIGFAVALPRRSELEANPVAGLGLYYVVVLPCMLFATARVSADFGANWWFDALPLRTPSAALEGGAKALLCGTYLPICALATALSVAFFSALSWHDGLLATVALSTVGVAYATYLVRGIPFSEQPSRSFEYRGCLVLLTVGVVLAALVGVHWFATLHWGVWVAALMTYVALFRVYWRRLPYLQPEPINKSRRPGGRLP